MIDALIFAGLPLAFLFGFGAAWLPGEWRKDHPKTGGRSEVYDWAEEGI